LFILLNSSQSRAQQVALAMLQAPYFSFADTEQLNSSFNWAVYMCIQMSSDFEDFVQLTKIKKTVCKSCFVFVFKHF
jgi:hypothetical protein